MKPECREGPEVAEKFEGSDEAPLPVSKARSGEEATEGCYLAQVANVLARCLEKQWLASRGLAT